METLHIRQFAARYRLPQSALAQRERLDKVLATILDEALERALERVGLASDEAICIRRLIVPVHLRLSRGDSALALDWSLALAGAIKRAAGGAHNMNLVHYGAPIHALIDLASGVTMGDYSRAWAWKQMGLWRAGERPHDRTAVQEFVRALCEQPAMIVPVLRSLAEAHVLQHLAIRLDVEQWTALAQAALSAVGASARLIEPEHAASPAPCSPFQRQKARYRVAASQLASSLTELARQRPEVGMAMGSLVLLDMDPGIFRSGEEQVRALVCAMAAILSPASASGSAASHTVEDLSEGEPSRQAFLTVRTGDQGFDDSIESTFEAANVCIERELQLKPPAVPSSDERPMPTVRRRAMSRYGGLLFLLGVIEDLGLPDEMLAHTAFAGRFLRWTLHRLALALVPGEPNDPAVLAFAGLLPDADPPSAGEDPYSDNEQHVIEGLVTRIVEELQARLDPLKLPTADVLPFVCSRRAEIIADPGWIEVRLSLNDVSTDIRRVGLDLDLGYLPWLGVVVRFLYE